jgi:hypothetical protein
VAFAFVKTVVTVGDKTAASSIVSAAAGMVGASAGNLAVAIIGKDNAATSDGNTNEVTSGQDTKGNVWLPAREFCNAQGAANAGVTVAVYYSVLTSALVASVDTITFNFSDTRTAKGFTVNEFSIGAGNTVAVESAIDLANDGADPGSMTLSGLPSREYLFIRALAHENPGATLTRTTNYGAMSSGSTSGGSGVTNISATGEYRILTGTGDTSDPTWTADDTASIYLAFKEVSGLEAELIGSPFGASGQSQMNQLLAQ